MLHTIATQLLRGVAFGIAAAAVAVPAWLAATPGFGTSAMPENRQTTPAFSESGYDLTPLTQREIERLAENLTEEQARVLLKKGTEPAFCGNLLDNKQEGTYACRLCGLPLFSSDTKFDSGSGWPSFYKPVDPDHLAEIKDNSLGMQRTEILCPAARATWATSSTTARAPPACATASTPPRSSSSRRASSPIVQSRSKPRRPTSPAAASGASRIASSTPRACSTR